MRTCAAALLLFAVTATRAADDVTVAGVTLGQHLYGAKVSPDDFQGKVVLVEFWGYHCASCLASMPHLARWHEELGPFGLMIVAPHAQSGERGDVMKTINALKLPFPVTDNGNIKGEEFKFIPHGVVFNHEGKKIYGGRPTDGEKVVRTAVGAALAAKASVKEPVGPVKAQLEALKKGMSPAAVLQKLLPLVKSNDKSTAEQAKTLLEALCAGGEEVYTAAEASAESDPIAAYDRARPLPLIYKGTPLGNKATELTGKLRSVKFVSEELKARPSLETVKKIDTALSAAAEAKDPKSSEFQKAFAAPLKQMKQTLTTMKRTCPDAKATREALDLGEKYGVVVK